jgi:colicin import membrane protein
MKDGQELNDGQELVEAPKIEVSLFEAWVDPIAELKELSSKQKFDITTYEGETACKKFIAKIGKMKTGVEKLRVSIKSEFLEKGRAVDKEAKEYQAIIAEIDAVHSIPLKELENKRINEALAEQEAIKAKARAEEAKRLADLEEREAKMAAKEAEQEAAERKEELLSARLEAAEVTKRQAEQAAILAKGVAEQEKANAILETERKAKATADALAKGITAKYEAEQAEQRKIDAGILARQQDVEHRRDYNNRASQALFIMIGNEEVSEAIVKAIVKGEVPNVTLNY